MNSDNIKSKIKLNIIPKRPYISNEMSLMEIVEKDTPPGWKDVFKSAKNELIDIDELLKEDKLKNGRYYPDSKDLFNAFHLTPLNKVKVVIFGQDPYFSLLKDNRPQAVGMSFSVPRDAPIPSSLKNIYKELSNTVKDFKIPNHGDLTHWCEEGVLLLNSCLTVAPNQPGSHKEIWLGFIKKVIEAIMNVNSSCIFVLWGRKAEKIKKMLGERAMVLISSHPSGLACYKGFFGCNHFNEINRLLIESGKKPIDWNLN